MKKYLQFASWKQPRELKYKNTFTLYFHSSNLRPNSLCILNSNHIKRPMAAVSLQPEQWSSNHRLASLTALISCNNGSTGGHSRSAAALSLYYWLMARLYKVIGNEHWTNFTYFLEGLNIARIKGFSIGFRLANKRFSDCNQRNHIIQH